MRRILQYDINARLTALFAAAVAQQPTATAVNAVDH